MEKNIYRKGGLVSVILLFFVLFLYFILHIAPIVVIWRVCYCDPCVHTAICRLSLGTDHQCHQTLSSERLDNTTSFWHLPVCGQVPLNIKQGREQSASVSSYLLNHPPALQILSLTHSTYWPHIHSSRRFASKPHNRELPDELNTSRIVVKSNYLYLFHEMHDKHLVIQTGKK